MKITSRVVVFDAAHDEVMSLRARLLQGAADNDEPDKLQV